MLLLERSPEYWAREATLDDLQQQVRAIPSWTEPIAEVLDFVYVERTMRALGGASASARDQALGLADHLERAAHDSVRERLDGLDRRYHARWRTLVELLHRRAAKLDVPHKVLDRKHVREILMHLAVAGGAVAQSELIEIPNEGQRSATLKLMESWELIERRADGTARTVSITDVGRLAIRPELEARSQARSASTLQRPCTYMSMDT